MRLVLSLLVLLNLALAPSAFAGEQLSFEPKVVQLSGLLSLQSFYGPPNYGDAPATDAIEVAAILELNAPIDVVADSKELEKNPDSINSKSFYFVSRIQLVPPDHWRATQSLGHRLTVEGSLFTRHTGHHHTDVLMSVTHIVSDRP